MDPQKRGKGESRKKLKNNDQKISKFDENYKPTYIRIPRRITLNITTPRHIIMKLLATNNKEKILKAGREKIYIMYRVTDKNDSRLLIRNLANQNTMEKLL